jgi:RNA recognition motif-containing protein
MCEKNSQIFVARLPREVNKEELGNTFRQFGKIKEVAVKRGV